MRPLSAWLDRGRFRATKRRGVRLGVAECETRAVPASLSGSVFVDANDNGVRDAGEAGIAGVRVLLVGKTDAGKPVHAAATTDADGNYTFADLAVGTYMLKEIQPAGYRDGRDAFGTGGGTARGNDVVRGIRVDCNETGYIFGEQASAPAGNDDCGHDPGVVPPPKGNNGVGNGLDPQPPGDPPVNDGAATEPGKPGNRGGAKK